MDVRPVRSDQAYRAMIAAPPEKRPDLYRHELMAPFKEKWDCYRVPLKAAQPGGYDVVMASEMLGILPPMRVDGSWAEAVSLIGDAAFWDELNVRLKKNALGLSGGEQQRVCIARALAVRP